MENTIRISGVIGDSIVDGTGIRMTVFTQGCPHHCKGCHNPQTHDFAGGYSEPISEILKKLTADPLQCGITVSGGEPFAQAESVAQLCQKVKALGKNVWVYSGYTLEELLAKNAPKGAAELLKYCDVLVDGRFEQELLDLDLAFRGSSNQRIINVPLSLATNTVETIDL